MIAVIYLQIFVKSEADGSQNQETLCIVVDLANLALITYCRASVSSL